LNSSDPRAFGDEGMDVQLFWLEILFAYLEILIGNFLYTGLRIELRKVASKEAVLGKPAL
jgi:hypothetical protein